MVSKCVLRNYPGIQTQKSFPSCSGGVCGVGGREGGEGEERGGGEDPEAGFQRFLPASTREISLLCIIAPPSTLIFKEVFTAAAVKAKQK